MMFRKTIEELEQDTREKYIIDLRDKDSFEKETYPGAHSLYWEELEDRIAEVPKNMPVYLLCYTGERSDEGCQGSAGAGIRCLQSRGAVTALTCASN